jgi:hypothetical protein
MKWSHHGRCGSAHCGGAVSSSEKACGEGRFASGRVPDRTGHPMSHPHRSPDEPPRMSADDEDPVIALAGAAGAPHTECTVPANKPCSWAASTADRLLLTPSLA